MRNKGFTLVELMIVVVIILMSTVGGVVYLNNFNAKQKLDKIQNKIVADVNLAHNFAKVKQAPLGYVSELRFVELTKNGNRIEANVNGVGTTYFSNLIADDDVTITFNPVSLYFWGGVGKLSHDIVPNNTFFGSGEMAKITIVLNQDVATSRVVVVNSLGGVE